MQFPHQFLSMQRTTSSPEGSKTKQGDRSWLKKKRPTRADFSEPSRRRQERKFWSQWQWRTVWGRELNNENLEMMGRSNLFFCFSFEDALTWSLIDANFQLNEIYFSESALKKSPFLAYVNVALRKIWPNIGKLNITRGKVSGLAIESYGRTIKFPFPLTCLWTGVFSEDTSRAPGSSDQWREKSQAHGYFWPSFQPHTTKFRGIVRGSQVGPRIAQGARKTMKRRPRRWRKQIGSKTFSCSIT